MIFSKDVDLIKNINGKIIFIARCVILPSAALFIITSCSQHPTYFGISLDDEDVYSDLQQLARQARAGDKRSQLELGIRFEEGRGVPQQLANARRLYLLAARSVGGPKMLFVPSAGGGRSAAIPFDTGNMEAGLPDALQRLRKLEAKREAWLLPEYGGVLGKNISRCSSPHKGNRRSLNAEVFIGTGAPVAIILKNHYKGYQDIEDNTLKIVFISGDQKEFIEEIKSYYLIYKGIKLNKNWIKLIDKNITNDFLVSRSSELSFSAKGVLTGFFENKCSSENNSRFIFENFSLAK